MLSLSMLPDSIWLSIISYLSKSDLQSLLVSSKFLKDKIQPYLYHELTLTEWASSGARLAGAIHKGIISDSTCECIRKLRIHFTSLEEISEALHLCIEIQPRMQSVAEIEVEAHTTDDALIAVGILAARYHSCKMFGAAARAPATTHQPAAIAQQVLPCLTSLRIPRLFKHEVSLLTSICELELDEIVDDGSMAVLRNMNVGVIKRIALPYQCYVDIGSPPCFQMELKISEQDKELVVNNAACTTLKLVAFTDLPKMKPILYTPSLKVLILCNIAPLPTIWLMQNNNLSMVEFISLAPVTIPALQALANQPCIPSLRLILVLVSRTSFLSDTPLLQKREARKLTEWLQVLAAQYPVDVRDFSLLLKEDIFFSDGLWCLAAQTKYRKYLPLVAPPPLTSL